MFVIKIRNVVAFSDKTKVVQTCSKCQTKMWHHSEEQKS
jgi:hypothetical protein